MNLEDLFPSVLPEAPGCPDAVALHHLRQSAIEFCQRTLVWTADLSSVPSVSGQRAYALPLPGGSALAKLLTFTIDGEQANVATPEKARNLLLADSGRDVAWTTDRVNVNVNPLPSSNGIAYVFGVALKPTQTATTIGDSLGEHYADDIAAGALARILAASGATWDNPKRAQERGEHFQHRIGVVAAQASKGFSRGERRVTPFHY